MHLFGDAALEREDSPVPASMFRTSSFADNEMGERPERTRVSN